MNDRIETDNKVVEDGTEQNYIDVINEMKKNTVPKNLYDKAIADNKKLANSLASSYPVEQQVVEAKVKPDIAKMRDELFNKEHSNIEFWDQTLKLRTAILEDGGEDIFMPTGTQVAGRTRAEIIADEEAAKRVAEEVQKCIDYAQGDSKAFTNELQRIMVDSKVSFYRR